MKLNRINIFSLLILLFLSAQVWADVWDTLKEDEFRENDVEDYVWKEDGSTVPDYPKESDLVEVSGSPAYKNYQYLIDVETLQVGADGVIRYSVIIRSPSGADNSFYEGIRCTSGEMKTYAYGITDMDDKKKFISKSDPRWRLASSSSVTGYGPIFIANYLCGFNGKNLKRNEIIKNIKYGKGNLDGLYY